MKKILSIGILVSMLLYYYTSNLRSKSISYIDQMTRFIIYSSRIINGVTYIT